MKIGEMIEGYDRPVLNEREIRASAGILFALGLITFMSAWQTGNFMPAKVMIVAFMLDFMVRLFINPRWAPSLIIGRFFVRSQQPEYVGAKQKRFAWWIGLVLVLIVFTFFVVKDIRGPVNLLLCILCLVFLFYESVFGVCIGCNIYHRFRPEEAKYCPGGTCQTTVPKVPILSIPLAQKLGVVVFLIGLLWFLPHGIQWMETHWAAEKSCTPPKLATYLGREDVWKQFQGCPDNQR